MIYSAADVFVIPSLQDNLPNTILESLACSTPVVGFNVGGISEVIDDGENGYLVEVGDYQGMAIRICQLLQDSSLRRNISIQCRKQFEAKFTSSMQVKSYLHLYEDIIQ